MRTVVPALMLGLWLVACRFDPGGLAPSDQDEPDASAPVDGPPALLDAAPAIDARPAPDADLGDWWDPAFSVRTRITVSDPPTGEALSDVPVLVVLDGARVALDRMREDGRDLRFVDDTGNQLDHEIERWDATDRSFVWVRVPEIPAEGGAGFWLYYGNQDADDAQEPAAVWSNDYLAVWHLAEQVSEGGQGGVHVDATGRGNDGVQDGNGHVAAASSGAIGGAQGFDGSDDRIAVPNDNLQVTGTSLTLLARVYLDEASIRFPNVLGGGSSAWPAYNWQIYWRRDTGGWAGRIAADNREPFVWTGAGELQQWHLVAVVYDGAALRLYVDGEPAGDPEPLSGDLEPLATELFIGDNPGEDPRELDGIIDEVRIATAARSHDWLRVQHASMSDALLAFAAPECLGGECP